MPAAQREITRDDIMDMDAYAKVRAERRREVVEIKRNRRLPVGPHAVFHFENFDTMLQQIHEMLYIERGGEEQLEDELSAYNPLIPKGDELVATIMFEVEDGMRRHQFLSALGGVEAHFHIEVGGQRIQGVPESDVERSTPEGKASSVHFIHFPFTAEQIRAFRQPDARVVVGIDHPNYSHMAVMPAAMREALAQDFD